MKKSIFLMSALLLFSMSFAKEMTLDEAVAYAKENNSSVLSIRAEKRKQEKNYDDMQSKTRKWQNKRAYSFEDASEFLIFKGYALEQAKLAYDMYLKNVESKEDMTSYNVCALSYQIDLLEKQIKLAEEQIKLLENELKVAELKLTLNIITSDKVDDASIKLLTAQNDLDKLKLSLDLTNQNLKKEMGFSGGEDLKIVLPELQNKKITIEDIDKYIEENIENNVNLVGARYQYKTIENNFRVAESGAWLESIDEKVAKDTYKVADAQLESQIGLLKIYFKNLFIKIKDNESQLQKTKDSIEIAETTIAQTEKMYELGMISRNTLENAQYELNKAKIGYEGIKINNFTLNEQFKMFAKSGATVN